MSHLQQDRPIDGHHRGHQHAGSSAQDAMQNEYSFEIDINQPDQVPPRQIPATKMKLHHRLEGQNSHLQSQKEEVQTMLKEMKKKILFISSTDWMYQNEQCPIDIYLKN